MINQDFQYIDFSKFKKELGDVWIKYRYRANYN